MEINNIISLSNDLAILVRSYKETLLTKNSINGKTKGQLIVNGRNLKVEGEKFSELLNYEISINDTQLSGIQRSIKITAEEIISKLK